MWPGVQGSCMPIQEDIEAEECLHQGLRDPGDQRGGSQALKLLSSLALVGDGLRAVSGSKMVRINLGAGLKPTGERNH